MSENTSVEGVLSDLIDEVDEAEDIHELISRYADKIEDLYDPFNTINS